MGEKIFILALTTLLIHGFAYALVPRFRDWLRDNPGIPKDYVKQVERDNPYNDRLNTIPGILERIFFTIVVVFSVSGGVISIIGWTTLKMATNWNKAFPREDHNQWSIEERTKMALCSLYAGLFSLSFALVSGLVIKWFLGWIE